MPDPRPTPLPASLERTGVPQPRRDRDGRQRALGPAPGTARAPRVTAPARRPSLDTIYGAIAAGVKALTVFAFSSENWRRPVDEVRYLVNFNRDLLERRQDELHEDGVRIVFSGRRDWRVPRGVLSRMDKAAALTQHNTVMTLNIAFNYGGRAEIVDAVRELVAEQVAAQEDR